MTLFKNGNRYPLAICRPPHGQNMPAVEVEMAYQSEAPKPVVGKVDTGAFRTMLNFHTANALGIQDPKQSPIDTGTAYSATGGGFPYYVHQVLVQIKDDSGQQILFPLEVAFADQISRNLFGVDWLAHFCLAVDSQAVHFLMA